ncbi:unnamed protein product [Mycetohabitans rhizoxinica HKI 454]|uniref:Uncharacterized protein n=1 Tax=Mycetohabitans rhizoxinica (strain DSM 19002 / CIP 109453 / HKI 454) TaxID=882378 RepID=E5AKE0_MYCRK|nr:unnamed protein product [Mycetohabitans rhizoxinica HKI 454]
MRYRNDSARYVVPANGGIDKVKHTPSIAKGPS